MFSIVTPSYRQLEWLQLAVASVADQEGVEVEHIIQDAGSLGIENFFEREALGRQNGSFKPSLFVEKDSGMYDAVNRGLRRAKGEFCAYLNCDEQYLPGALEAVANVFAKNERIEVIFGDAVLLNQECIPISYRKAVLPTISHLRASHLPTLSCSMFFRRRLLDRGFFFDPGLKDVGDAAWAERLLAANVKMATFTRPLGCFAFTGSNRSALPDAKKEGRQRADGGRALTRAVIIAHHRMAKALRGAYLPRRVKISVFTPDSPARRVTNQRWVGYRWPI